jgi:PAS domain S-box-containing protein
MPRRLIYGRRILHVAVAGLLVVAVSFIRYLAAAVWNPGLSFTLFYPVLLVCTWLGGFALAVLATALWIFSLLVFLHYHPTIAVNQSLTTLGALVLEGLIVSYLFDRLRSSARSAQEQQRNVMKVFINEAPAAIAMFDTEMRYIAASKRWYTDYKISQHSVVGLSHYDVFPEIPERWRLIHQRCLLGATERAEEDLFIRPDGSHQWVRWEVKPWTSEAKSSRVGGIFIFAEDITSLKQAYERASELTAQNQVDAALRVEAETLNRSKDEFLATLSHELRSPLHALLGWVHVLKRSAGNPQHCSQALSAIESSVKLIGQLISDLLDVNRIVSGKLRLNIERVSMEQLLREVVETSLPQAQEKKVVLELKPVAADLAVRGDPVRLRQCVSNLLSNAIKFTPSGGRIEVMATASDDAVRITVRDTGQGIQAEAIPYLFERYAQASPASTRMHGGLGLGLSIVKHLVGLHGGEVAASSPGVGLGSTFTISLPALHAGDSLQGLVNVPESVDKPDLLKKRTILVVDDDVQMRELVRALLEDHGAQVRAASSVDEGIKMSHATAIDLVVSDIVMPQEDRYDLMRALRADGLTAPAIAVSGRAGDEDVRRALEAGFRLHLTKPVDAQELLGAIQRILQANPDEGGQRAGNQ